MMMSQGAAPLPGAGEDPLGMRPGLIYLLITLYHVWCKGACGPRALETARPSLQLELRFLDQLAHAVQEPVSGHAVDHPVIVRERKVHHLATADGFLAVQLPHHRALDDLAHAQDADLRLVDDGGPEQVPLQPGIGDGERPAGQLVRRDLAGARARGEIVDRAGQPEHAQLVRLADDRNEESLLRLHSDAEVHVLAQDDALVLDDGVEARELRQRLHGGAADADEEAGRLSAGLLGPLPL